MKKIFVLLVFLLPLAACRAAADDPAPTAADVAAQQAADERYKRLEASLEAVQMDNESMKAKIVSLEQKIEDMRQQLAAASNNSGVQEDLKRLADSIAQVDKKREEDKQAISEEIHKSMSGLEKSLAAPAAPVRTPPLKMTPDAPAPPQVDGFAYTVQDGDNLSAIVKAYNADFKSKNWRTISLRQAMEANPNVKWDHLRVGQKIVIPKPEGQ
ncbi:MAG TPA: LysM domain-containing protein [Verrucomicrobiae bacterium]|jgi:hypothetical protein